MSEAIDSPLIILLVDDNDADLKIAIRAFKNARFKNNLFTVNGGQACLDFLRHQGIYTDSNQYPRPHMVLLDISMPGMDGFEVLQTLKSDKTICDIPVTMLTASKNEHDIGRSYSLGASNFIQKPVTYEEFVRVVDGFSTYGQKIKQ